MGFRRVKVACKQCGLKKQQASCPDMSRSTPFRQERLAEDRLDKEKEKSVGKD
jgi:hypothetical protein